MKSCCGMQVCAAEGLENLPAQGTESALSYYQHCRPEQVQQSRTM